MLLPFGEWLPDQAAFFDPRDPAAANIGPRTDTATNVVPRSPTSYGPFASLASFAANALGARCQGAIAALDSSGNASIFAGDATDLYRLTIGSTSFSTVSKASHPYSADPGGRWWSTQFGNQILMGDYNDAIQAFTMGTSTLFADLAGTPPKARDGATVKNFVFLLNTNDLVNGVQKQRAWWSGVNATTSWPTPGTSGALAVQSDFNDFPGEHGDGMRVVPNLSYADVALVFERGVFRGQYTGAPYFFQFAPAERVRGTPSPDSVVQDGAVFYYMGQDLAFYAFDGANSKPIGAGKVDRTFAADVDTNYLDRVSGAVDPLTKLVYWAYPTASDGTGICKRVLVYNPVFDRFALAADAQSIEKLMRSLSIGYTIEQIAGPGGLYPNLESVPLPLDSKAYAGGLPKFGAFDGTHTFGTFTGPALAPRVDTVELQPFPDQLAFVNNARAVTDGGTPSVALAVRNRHQDARVTGSAVAADAYGNHEQRAVGRYVCAELTLPAASTFTHLSGVEVEGVPYGRR